MSELAHFNKIEVKVLKYQDTWSMSNRGVKDEKFNRIPNR